MSLAKCKACGHEVSKKADKCPNCGEPLKSKPAGCGSVVVLAVLVLVIIGMFGGKESSTEPAKPLTPEEQRAEIIQRQFSAWDGSHRNLESFVKANLKDPDSYQHVETKYVDRGKEGIYVLMTYRAKNGFGGYNVGKMAAVYDIEGNALVGPASLDE